jgi:hypothetical protein
MPDQDPELRALDFGHVDSESELDLDAKFLRTSDFEEFVGRRCDLVRGPKGSGKSALFRLFARHEDYARLLGGSSLDYVLLATATGLGGTHEVSTDDIKRLEREGHFDVEQVWFSYLALKAAEAIKRPEFRPRGELARFMRSTGIRTDRRLLPSIKRMWNRAVSDTTPTVHKLQVLGSGLEVGGQRQGFDAREVLHLVDEYLRENGLRVWLLFDNLDELFPLRREKRAEVLSALFSVCNQVRGSLDAIEPKLFIRSDIWNDLEFTNKSHWVGKQLDLTWSPDQLAALMLKRALAARSIRERLSRALPQLTGPNTVEELSHPERQAALHLLFEPTLSADGWPTWQWMLDRARDGQFGPLPRELITFGMEARTVQLEGRFDASGALISGEAVRRAYPVVSRLRCETFLSEFPELREHFHRFRGQTTPRFHRAQLEGVVMKDLEPSGKEMVEALCEAGVIQPSDGHHRGVAKEFDVPLLYRPGLGLLLRGRR